MSVFLAALRLLARLSGLMVAGVYVFMVIGEVTHPHSRPPSEFIEWAGIILMSVTCAGMLVAWRWELPGAALSLASLVAFTLLIRMSNHTVLWVLSAPGILYFTDWFLRRMELKGGQ